MLELHLLFYFGGHILFIFTLLCTYLILLYNWDYNLLYYLLS